MKPIRLHPNGRQLQYTFDCCDREREPDYFQLSTYECHNDKL